MGWFGKKKDNEEEFKTPEMIEQEQKEEFESSEKFFKALTTGLTSEQKIDVIGEMVNDLYQYHIGSLSVEQLENLKINTSPINNNNGNHKDSESEEKKW